jgi:small subunit ribosomal protein S6e
MAFKINVSHKGKTAKFETENEGLMDMVIGDKLSGKEVSADLEGYELEITGTSDKAGFPGFKGEHGPNLRRKLLTLGKGMWNRTKGIRLRKTVRGEQISIDTVQINMNVLKEGSKKFEEFVKPKEAKEEEKK